MGESKTFLTDERDGEYDEESHLNRDGLPRLAKKFKCPGECKHMVNWGSMAYCKNFYNEFVKHNSMADCRAKNCSICGGPDHVLVCLEPAGEQVIHKVGDDGNDSDDAYVPDEDVSRSSFTEKSLSL